MQGLVRLVNNGNDPIRFDYAGETVVIQAKGQNHDLATKKVIKMKMRDGKEVPGRFIETYYEERKNKDGTPDADDINFVDVSPATAKWAMSPHNYYRHNGAMSMEQPQTHAEEQVRKLSQERDAQAAMLKEQAGELTKLRQQVAGYKGVTAKAAKKQS